MSYVREVEIAGRTIRLEFQKFAKQANGSVMVSCGDTQVLVTATAADSPKEGQDFFPLTVDYLERFYATGRIPGGFFKREARPTEGEILTSRGIDRPLRPCFPELYRNDTFITCIVMSVDHVNHPSTLALLGASCALMVSDIPFDGPVANIRLGLKDGQYVVDPPHGFVSDLDLNIAAKPGAVLMVEAGANFLSEDQMLDAITHAHKLMEPLFAIQEEIRKDIGRPKKEVQTPKRDAGLATQISSKAKAPILDAFSIRVKQDRQKALKTIDTKVKEEFNPEGNPAKGKEIATILEDIQYRALRDLTLQSKRRIDGRALDEIRPLFTEVGTLKRAHGSALFQRGETQALASITLGAGDDEQRLDTILTKDAFKRFLLHYIFPPFSTGEAKPIRAPTRREIGHGNLAEKALERIIPEKGKFGYTIRLVSEVLESNGSSSMATVCGGTMALLHAGVPIKEPVAGIAMGLVKEGDDYVILSDILGDEDHLGDMDFKVCGGANGITALQMDIKIGGLSRKIMAEALEQARAGRNFILKKLVATIAEPGELSLSAPRIFQIKIRPDKVRELIGPGGKTVKKIIAETGVKVDISDDGMISIVSPDVTSAEAAKQLIRSVTADPELGAIYLGTVKKIMDFGAFVEIKPGVEGLVHISQLADQRVANVSDILKEGDEVMVKLLEVDRQGKMKLSRKEALGKKPTA